MRVHALKPGIVKQGKAWDRSGSRREAGGGRRGALEMRREGREPGQSCRGHQRTEGQGRGALGTDAAGQPLPAAPRVRVSWSPAAFRRGTLAREEEGKGKAQAGPWEEERRWDFRCALPKALRKMLQSHQALGSLGTELQ